MAPVKKTALKDGLLIKEGKTRTYLAASAAKILKTNKTLAPSTKKTLERAVKRESGISVTAYEIIYKGAAVAQTMPFENSVKITNGYKRVFAGCKKTDAAAVVKNLRKIAKEHATSFSHGLLWEVRDKPRERFAISLRIRGKSKPSFEVSIFVWIGGRMYDVEMKKTATVDDMVQNLKYAIKTLAKAA